LANQYTEIHKDIVEACKRGDQKAQYKLYQLYSKAMFNICYRLMNKREEAEDLLQECFTEAFVQLDSFRYESSFGAWLRRIVINRCINALKKRKINMVLYDDMIKFDKETDSDPVDDSYLQLTVKRVHQALERLADGYRVIFSLYLLEGYDHSEIGEILGISESTSKSQFMRAKRKVKEMLLTMEE
jgi:RNA polymerase sigma-70 factor (ECF subfamily)